MYRRNGVGHDPEEKPSATLAYSQDARLPKYSDVQDGRGWTSSEKTCTCTVWIDDILKQCNNDFSGTAMLTENIIDWRRLMDG